MDAERPAVPAYSDLPEEHGSGGVQLDSQGNKRENGSAHKQTDRGARQVEEALHRAVINCAAVVATRSASASVMQE
jgi:hypothetical protein